MLARYTLIVATAVAAFCLPAPAQTPLGTAFTYQGRLKNAGSPANGLYDLRFRLHDAPTGGAPVGSVLCLDNVNVTDGLFTVPLDFGAQFAGQQRFLEIEVRADTGLNCANATGFIILTPRQALAAAPNALFALNADLLDGLDSTAFLQTIPVPLTLSGTSASWIIRGENASTAPGSAGIYGVSTGASGSTYGFFGVANSTAGIGVLGRAAATTGDTSGVYGQNFSTTGYGVFGKAVATTGVNYGVYGESASSTGYGVFGLTTDNAGVKGMADGTTGANYGVYGESASSGGYGVYGINTNNIGVRGTATGTTGANYGVWGHSSSTAGFGVYGTNADNVGVRGEATSTTGFNYGVQGHSNSSGGYGVYGTVNATTGTTRGGYFQSSSTTGRGVEGANLATSGANYGGYFFTNSGAGTGVFASAGGGAGTSYGVHGQSTSATGRGVYGTALGSDITTGVWGEASSTTGRGVFGDATAASGTTYGLRGESSSTTGRGVFGWATSGTGSTLGVYGRSDSPDGAGVRGYCSATTNGTGDFPFGVFGEVLGDYGSGVYGLGDFYGTTGRFNNAVTGFGVFSFGTLGASGAKTFRIDHPDDPKNKYLLHYSSESPECLNFYSGTAVLDGGGFAVVEMPAYFAKINKDPRYQLTAVGGPMPLLHVASEVSPAALESGAVCSFRIGGGAPGGKVSWRLEAVRNDLYVQRYGAPVEVDKRPGEKGTYQHPELYGKPIEMRVDYTPPDARNEGEAGR